MLEFISSLIGSWFGSRTAILQTKTEHKYQDAKSNLHILLKILEDLSVLEQAFIFKGKFCPLIEHRVPVFSQDDEPLKMSYAQRGHQFRMIGNRIIRNCRRIVFLTPKNDLPKVLAQCKDINNFLCSKKSQNTKSHLDLMIHRLISSMKEELLDDSISEFATKMANFHASLASNIEEELPYLSEENKTSRGNFVIVCCVLLVLAFIYYCYNRFNDKDDLRQNDYNVNILISTKERSL